MKSLLCKLSVSFLFPNRSINKIEELNQKDEENGIKVGRPKKGNSDWEKIYDWLWNNKYREDYCHAEVFSQLSIPEAAITLDLSIFKNMLDEQRRKLTSNSLASKNGFRSNRNFDDVYVPLGLVKPKDEPKRDFKNAENDPRLGSRFYHRADYEITEKFSNTEFFEKVLSQEKIHRLAIVGEPGAGKTTLLQKISTWIEKEKPDAQIIWVSLAKLKNKSLKDYLLDEWLKNAKDVSETTKAEKDALIQIFKAGNVWLLLDGVDEMGINNPLFNLHEQITECWLKYAKIILSCRLNVWEVGRNHLYKFEVYRNLDFSESEREQFIKNWFKENPTLADQLITELNQDKKERIRDLVKNPLRLTMICFSCHKNKGKLPDTKAGLYKECVDAFYDWKANEVFSTTPTERKELNKALGELAKSLLEQDSAWFRITHQQICECEYLGNPKEEGLGKKAIKLGWLNPVGVSEKNSDDEIYAFFHPSFQEYFATLAIGENLDILETRIFQKNWQEVIALWMGRSDIRAKFKNEFIEKILSFEDISCSKKENYNFYQNRAFLIAAQGLLEFRECDQLLVKKIIDYLISIVYNPYFPIEIFQAKLFDCLMKIGCSFYKAYLKDAILSKYDDYKIAIEEKNKLDGLEAQFYPLAFWKSEEYFLITLTILNILDKNKYETEFFQYLNYCKFVSNSLNIALRLEKYDKKSAINTLKKIIESKTTYSTYSSLEFSHYKKIDAIRYLFGLDPKNSEKCCINYLESIIKKVEDFTRNFSKLNNHKDYNKYADDYGKYVKAIGLLIKIHPQNIFYLEKLLNFIIITEYGYDLDWDILFDISKDHIIDSQYIEQLKQICKNNTHKMCSLFQAKIEYIIFKFSAEYTEDEFISYLEKIIEENLEAGISDYSEDTLLELCYALLQFKQNNTLVNKALKKLIDESQTSWIVDKAIQCLPHNALNESDLIKTIDLFRKRLQENNSSSSDVDNLFKLLWQITENMSYLDFYKAWHSQPYIIHPEILEISPLGSTAITQTLNQQILDLPSQLQPTEKTYPLVINAKSLEKIKNENSLSQSLCNKIYKIIFPQTIDIPKVDDPPDLETEIRKIKHKIQKENLVLIFHKGEPNETLISVCEQLADEIYYKFITDQPIESESRIPPQENLVNILQNWINELG